MSATATTLPTPAPVANGPLNPPEPLTHAERHPELAPLPPRRRNDKRLDTDQRSAKKDAANVNRDAKAALRAELKALKKDFEAALANTAQKYNTSAKYVEKLIGTSAQFKGQRAPTAQNAILHYVANIVNEGMPLFDRLRDHSIF